MYVTKPCLNYSVLRRTHVTVTCDVRYGSTSCAVFKRGGTKLERFLPKNQHRCSKKIIEFSELG